MIKKILRKAKVLIYDIRKYVIKGDAEKRRYFIAKYKAYFKKIKNKMNTKKQQMEMVQFKEQLMSYLQQVTKQECSDFIFLFSGTTFIQEKRGNRPIRLTKEWLKQGVPVLFSYYRWNKGEEIPKTFEKDLYQVPIDVTMTYLDEIIKYDLGTVKKTFIVSFPYPELARYIGQLKMNNWKIIYDVRDNWEEFHKVNMARWYSKSIEKFFVCNCDVVCCVAKPLQEKMQAYTQNKQVLLSPNALDINFYQENNNNQKKEKSSSITIGYVGHLSDAWFDWESLIQVAAQNKNWQFELIGHFEPAGIQLPSNLRLLGSKEHRDIKQIASKWNVAIIPFKTGDLSDCVDPIKIYEYLAMGLPVVSFRMPQIHDYPNVYIAQDASEFAKCIDKAASMEFDRAANEYFLKNNTWELRAKELIEWVRQAENLEILM